MKPRLAVRVVASVSAVIAIAGAPAIAQPGAGTPRGDAARRPIEQLAALVQRRLGLSDDQATKLRAVTGRVAVQRQELLRQEREARRALRSQMTAGSAADQQAVSRHLDDLLRLQQRRVALLAEEQHDLASFLTPLQRADFLAMQERAFRAAQQLRQQRAARP